ncbi:type IV pilus modification protein PilV [Pseudomonas sp. NPDC090202]|uniref:type IV pilus modification protein PilV n=1 Tax=unclassified Pseudomonas TaxID=196821 RepID=UPI00381DB205
MALTRTRSAGFTMIEVLVSLLIIVIGILGMVALQSKAIPYTQDSVQRNTAMMLVDDLVEIIRTKGDDCTSGNNCLKAPGASFPAAPATCIPTPTLLPDQIGCWAVRAGNALPGATALLSSGNFFICRSVVPGDETVGSCATTNATNTEVEIQVGWTVKQSADCMAGSASTTPGVCTYRLRTRVR